MSEYTPPMDDNKDNIIVKFLENHLSTLLEKYTEEDTKDKEMTDNLRDLQYALSCFFKEMPDPWTKERENDKTLQVWASASYKTSTCNARQEA